LATRQHKNKKTGSGAFFSTTDAHLNLMNKLCFETKMTKVSSKNLLMKSSKNNFISLLGFYLIMCFMKPLKDLGKIAILKIGELISLGGVKIHFGKLAM